MRDFIGYFARRILKRAAPAPVMSTQADHLQKNYLTYRPDIDGLRAVAVLAVVIYHAFPRLLPGGFVGVDIFFVISGYLISSIILKNLTTGQFSFRDFYARRIRRIFPALLVVLLATGFAGYILLLPDEFASLGRHMAASAVYVENFLLWQETGYFDTVSETKPLKHLWSLAVEEQFYIVTPLLLWGAYRYGLRMKGLVVMLTGLAIVSFIANIFIVDQYTAFNFLFPMTRFWEMWTGGILAWWTLNPKNTRPEHKPTQAENTLSTLGSGLIVLAVILIIPDSSYPGALALLPVGGASCLILAGPHARINRYILSHPVMVAIGLISYPIYLWHWPLISFAHITLGPEVYKSSTFAASVLGLCAAASIPLAYTTWRIIETPLRFGHKTVPVLSASLCAIALAGSGLIAQNHIQPFFEHIEYNAFKEGDAPRRLNPEHINACQKKIRLADGDCATSPTDFTETIAIVGDSHAGHSYEGIEALLTPKNINTILFSFNNCAVFAESVSPDKCRSGARTASIQAVMEYLIKTPSITKVFFFSRGEYYISGTVFQQSTKPATKVRSVSENDFYDGLQAVANMLHSAGKKVYYVTENPELGFHPRQCLGHPLRPRRSPCSVPTQAVIEHQTRYLKGFESLENITIIESIPAFCDTQHCQIIRDGDSLYHDSDHLSSAGSRFQAEKLLLPYLLE
jgi:peptidoglycan/LPS O-acetylase OafA/YrhL